MVRILVVILLFYNISTAIEAGISLDAATVDSTGSQLSLRNGVKISLSMGEVTAQTMKVFPSPSLRSMTTAKIDLQGDVTIKLADGTIAKGNSATLDSNLGEAILFGTPVTYSGRDGWSFSALEVLLKLGPKQDSPRALSGIICKGNVEISYNNLMKAYGEIAHYHKGCKGIEISLDPRLGESCKLVDNKGSQINANRFLLYPEEQRLIASNLSGEFSTQDAHGIHLLSNHGSFDLAKNLIELKDNTTLSGEDYEIDITGTVAILLTSEKEFKRSIESLQIEGGTKVHFKDYSMVCDGRTVVDHKKGRLTMWPHPGTQVVCRNPTTSLSGNLLEVGYVSDGKSFTPKNGCMSGQAHLINGAFGGGGDDTWQSISADRIEYLPLEQVWVFSSTQPRCVIYKDNLNALLCYASNLFAQRNHSTGSLNLHSVGNVRFGFGERELKLLERSIPRSIHVH